MRAGAEPIGAGSFTKYGSQEWDSSTDQLPYTIKAKTSPLSEIPASRRAHFKYEIFQDQRSAAWGDAPPY